MGPITDGQCVSNYTGACASVVGPSVWLPHGATTGDLDRLILSVLHGIYTNAGVMGDACVRASIAMGCASVVFACEDGNVPRLPCREFCTWYWSPTACAATLRAYYSAFYGNGQDTRTVSVPQCGAGASFPGVAGTPDDVDVVGGRPILARPFWPAGYVGAPLFPSAANGNVTYNDSTHHRLVPTTCAELAPSTLTLDDAIALATFTSASNDEREREGGGGCAPPLRPSTNASSTTCVIGCPSPALSRASVDAVQYVYAALGVLAFVLNVVVLASEVRQVLVHRVRVTTNFRLVVLGTSLSVVWFLLGPLHVFVYGAVVSCPTHGEELTNTEVFFGLDRRGDSVGCRMQRASPFVLQWIFNVVLFVLMRTVMATQTFTRSSVRAWACLDRVVALYCVLVPAICLVVATVLDAPSTNPAVAQTQMARSSTVCVPRLANAVVEFMLVAFPLCVTGVAVVVLALVVTHRLRQNHRNVVGLVPSQDAVVTSREPSSSPPPPPSHMVGMRGLARRVTVLGLTSAVLVTLEILASGIFVHACEAWGPAFDAFFACATTSGADPCLCASLGDDERTLRPPPWSIGLASAASASIPVMFGAVFATQSIQRHRRNAALARRRGPRHLRDTQQPSSPTTQQVQTQTPSSSSGARKGSSRSEGRLSFSVFAARATTLLLDDGGGGRTRIPARDRRLTSWWSSADVLQTPVPTPPPPPPPSTASRNDHPTTVTTTSWRDSSAAVVVSTYHDGDTDDDDGGETTPEPPSPVSLS